MHKKKRVRTIPALLVSYSLLFGALRAQTTLDPAVIEKSFIEWSQTAPKSELGPFGAYLRKLRNEGRSDGEVEQVRAILDKLFLTRPAITQIVFDYNYTKPVAGFRTKPNALLSDAIRNLPPGKALDVCMGQGRNSVFLAQQGWQVTGFDISSEGLKIAQAAAEKAGLKLQTIQSTSESFDYGKDQWDLIVLSYAWGPFQDPAYISKIEASLRKGGLLVWEQYSNDESKSSKGSPRLLNPVLNMFGRFRILRYEYAMARPDWSPEGPVERITRLVAQKI